MRRSFLKKTSVLAASLGLALTLGLSSSAVMAQTKVAKLGHAMPSTHPQATAMNKFADLVKQYTQNRVNVQTFDSAQFGGDDKMLQAVQTGTQEFYIGSLAPLSGRVKEVQIFDFPFMFDNIKEVHSVFGGAMGQKILDKLAPTNMVGLAWSETGFRNLSNNKRRVLKADDISGLKVRVMQNPVALDTWKTLGANAVSMSFSEVFTALETKALDAQENPLLHMYTNKMYEVQKYITITNHVYSPVALVVSKKFYDSLTPADQAAVKKAAVEACKYQDEMMDKGEEQTMANLKKEGMTIDTLPPAELAKLKAKTQPVIEKYTATIGEPFVKEFYAAIEQARKSGK